MEINKNDSRSVVTRSLLHGFTLLVLILSFGGLQNSWAAKNSGPAVGSKAWLSCQSGFEANAEKFVSRLHPQIEDYLAKTWSEYKFGRAYVSFNRGDTIDSLTELQYRKSTSNNYYQNVTIEVRDRYTVNTILDLSTRIKTYGQVWEGPLEGYPKSKREIMTNIFEDSWPLQIRGKKQQKQKDGMFQGARIDFLAGPSRAFSDKYPSVMSQVYNGSKSDIDSWPMFEKFHPYSLAFLAEDPVIVTKVTIGMAAHEAIVGGSLNETYVQPVIPIQSLYAAVDSAIKATRAMFGSEIVVNWALLPSKPPFTSGVNLEHESFYFMLSGPDLRWGGIKENMYFFKHVNDYLVKHHKDIFK